MAKTRLTDDYIRTRERPAKGNVIDYDTEAKGLAVRFTPSGVPTFLFCYGSSVAGGSARRMAIGRWTDASGKRSASVLPKMRARAAELALAVMAKRDPYAEQLAEAERDAAQREAERQERERAAVEAEAARLREARDVSVDDLCDRYLQEHGPKLRPDTRRRVARRMDRYLRPAWGTRKAKDITRADVVALLKPLRAAAKYSELVHVLSLVNGLFAFAVDDDELETITVNPALGLKKKVLTKTERPKPKDRALVTRREFRAFYLVTKPGKYMTEDAADCLRLMMLTGCRPSEAADSPIVPLPAKKSRTRSPGLV